MTSFTKKHGTGGKLFAFDIPEHFEYVNLQELVDRNGLEAIYKINALYINKKGKFGDAPVIATDTNLVNAPQHLLATVLDVLEDQASRLLIDNGEVGFKIYEYTNSYGLNYAVEWVDIPKPRKKKPATE